MSRAVWSAVALLVLLALLGPALARGGDGQSHGEGAELRLFRPAEVVWKEGPPSLPPGARIAVLEGDPAKEGPFTMRLRLPDGYRIPPHTHPKTERLTVLSGTFRLGMGARFDARALKDLPAGTYGFWPAGMQHFVETRGETVVQLHGMGPWSIVYVNPADDPRTARK